MATAEGVLLGPLYAEDETAWLEAMAALAAQGRYGELDLPHLAEYLTDVARCDRREVFSRLVVLLTHLLKWDYQQGRGGPWRGTIREQRRELRQLLESGTLRSHAAAILADAYAEARHQAADEAELDLALLPEENPWTMAEVLGEEIA